MLDIFGAENSNLIQDENYYYVFRALNSGDDDDIASGKTIKDSKIVRVRTDGDRWNEKDGAKSRYTDINVPTLEEVWDHIRKNHSYETNCISFTTNGNVVLDYGTGKDHNKRYILMKLPKSNPESGKVFFAGKFMLNQVSSMIDKVLEFDPPSSEVMDLINDVDNAEDLQQVRDCIEQRFEMMKIRSMEGTYNSSSLVNRKRSFTDRIRKKSFFSDEQQLQYNKVIAKLSLLESSGKLKKIISYCRDNASLISAIGMAFSSSEMIHYREINEDEFVEISEEYLEMLSLIQQAKEQKTPENQIREIEEKILDIINSNYKIHRTNSGLVIQNENEDGANDRSIQYSEFEDRNFTMHDAFKLTNGRVGYQKTKQVMEFYYRLSVARKKALEHANLLQEIFKENNQTIEFIRDNGFVVDGKIVTRKEASHSSRISESVRISFERENQVQFSDAEQKRIIEAVLKMSEEDLNKTISSFADNIKDTIIENFADRDNEINENEYYANYFIDNINTNRIYAKEDKIVLTDEERQLLASKLTKANCENLYNVLSKIDLTPAEMSSLVLSLLRSDGYKGYNFAELSEAEDLEDIVRTNLKNGFLKARISALSFEALLDRIDDRNIIEGTQINLRDYQQETVDNIDKIYEEKRFAGVILPTGGGKSFVAMAEMMKYKGKNILYIAPNVEILSQIKRHIIKNVLNIEIIPDKEPLPKDDGTGKRKMHFKEAEKEIESVLKIKTMCYAGLDGKEREYLRSYNPDFIILDELHRSGAKTWEPQVRALLSECPSAKVLGITATPQRDVDGKDMMDELAKMSGDYSEEEIESKRHIAKEMYLLDAIKDGIVVEPKIVTFNYQLEESDEYAEIIRLYNEAPDGSEEKRRLQDTKNRMDEIIRKSKAKGIRGIVNENIKKKDGKYIIFLPHRTSEDEGTSEDYMSKKIEEVKEYFKDIDPDPEISYLISDREDKKENLKAINSFETSKSSHLKLIFAVDMLNEGVHVDGIDGCMMLRPISDSSKILYLQQLGRSIYSIDPEHPDVEGPVIFDVYNNYLVHNLNKDIKKGNIISDLQRLQEVVNWMEKHRGYVPNINSEDIKEARRAIILKKTQEKYTKYVDEITNHNLTEAEKNQINRIVELGNSIELWDIDIPDRIIPPGEDEIDNPDTFEVKGEVKEFFDLFKKATKERNVKLSNGLLLRRTIETLEILTENGIEINNQTITPDIDFKEIYQGLPQKVKDELAFWETDETFDLFGKYNEAKEMLYYRQVSTDKVFLQYDIKDLRMYGLFEPFVSSRVNKELSTADSDGFVLHGPQDFMHKNIYTGTFFSREGKVYEKPEQSKESENVGVRFDKVLLLKRTIETLRILTENGIEINNATINPHSDFKEIYQGLPQEVKDELNSIQVDETFNLPLLYQKAKEQFYYKSNNPKMDKVFLQYDLRDLRKYGLFETVWGLRSAADYYGFIIRGPQEFLHKNIYTGTFFSKDGERYSERDIHGAIIPDSEKVYKVLEILIESGFKKDQLIDIDFKEFYSSLPDETKQLLGELDINENYNFNENFNIARRQFYNGAKLFEKYMEAHNLEYFYRLGLCEPFTYTKRVMDTIVKGEFYKSNNKFNGFSIKTFTKYGEDGYNKEGIDRHGFSRDGIYRTAWYNQGRSETRRRIYDDHYFNQQGFYCIVKGAVKSDEFDDEYYRYRDVGEEVIVTDKKYDDHHFNQDGFYCEVKEDGTVVVTDQKIHNGFDRDGYFYTQDSNGQYIKTDRTRDDEGYNIDGVDIHGFSRDGIHIETGTIVDVNGLNQDGFYCEQLENGEYRVTAKRVGKHNFDIDGLWYEEDENGKLVCTNRPLNPRRFDKNGFYYEKDNSRGYPARHTGKLVGNWYYEPIDMPEDHASNYVYGVAYENTRRKTDRNGFDIDGLYHDIHPDGTVILKPFDKHGFNYEGFYCIVNEDGSITVTEEKIHNGFDRFGNFYTLNKDGVYEKAHSKYNALGFNIDGFNRDGYSKEGYSKDGYDCHGFDKYGIHKVTKSRYNERGFMADGLCYMQKDGTIGEKGSKLDRHAFDIDGLYWQKNKSGTMFNTYKLVDPRGFHADGTNELTGGILDARNFDIDGFYYRKNADGEMVKTKKMVDDGLFDCRGFNYTRDGQRRKSAVNIYGFSVDRIYRLPKFQDQNQYTATKDESSWFLWDSINKQEICLFDDLMNDLYRDEHGFDYDGVNKYTGTKVDLHSFSRDGSYCRFNEELGRYEKVKPETKLNPYGFDIDGFLWVNGVKTNKRRTEDGYNIDGLDIHGFTRDGICARTGEIVDRCGFNQQGLLCIKNEDGTYTVTDRKFDDDGFNIDGVTEDLFDRYGTHQITGERYDENGFDAHGLHKDTRQPLDPNGFDKNGINPKTGTCVDEFSFNNKGFYCVQDSDGNYVPTEKKVDPEGFDISGLNLYQFDRNGFYKRQPGVIYNERGFKADGTYQETGLKYNGRMFDIFGRNIFTKTRFDLRGFNEDGDFARGIDISKQKTLPKHDRYGFDVDGIHRDTHELLDSTGYNAYGVDKDGKNRKGEIDPTIQTARGYIQDILTKGFTPALWCKLNKKTMTDLNKMLYKAGEMYPKLKEELCELCQKLLDEVKQLESSDPNKAQIKLRRLERAKKIFEYEDEEKE